MFVLSVFDDGGERNFVTTNPRVDDGRIFAVVGSATRQFEFGAVIDLMLIGVQIMHEMACEPRANSRLDFLVQCSLDRRIQHRDSRMPISNRPWTVLREQNDADQGR
jgi:hypothetical protein